MGVLNRTLDVTEQRKVLEHHFGATATGVTLTLALVPYAATIEEAQIAAWGLSGSPTVALAINRFITGSGFTTIIFAVGTSNTPAEFGTSGPGAFGASTFGASGMVMAAYGSTLLNVLPNDLISLTTGGTNAAVKALSVGIVLKPIQDSKTHFNLF